MKAGKITAERPSLVKNRASRQGLRPSFALLGDNEISAATANWEQSAVGEFTRNRVRVTFDLTLTNDLEHSDLDPSTLPAPPVNEVVAFPFATEPAGLFGWKVRASPDWDIASHNFFNDGLCLGLPTPPADCFRSEAFGATLDARSSATRRVGFDVDPSVTSFTVDVAVAADIDEQPIGNATECVGTLSGTFGNIVVPPGASCFLQAATVNGDVKALEASRLFLRSVTVGDNVEGRKAYQVDVIQLTNAPRNLVLGSIQIEEGDNFARVCGTDLPNGNIQIQKMRTFVLIGGLQCSGFGGGNTLARGNIKVEENNIVSSLPTLPELDIRDNSVGGNVQVFKNVGPGEKTVQTNTVGEALQCIENEAPFVGGPNTAGRAEGQCF